MTNEKCVCLGSSTFTGCWCPVFIYLNGKQLATGKLQPNARINFKECCGSKNKRGGSGDRYRKNYVKMTITYDPLANKTILSTIYKFPQP